MTRPTAPPASLALAGSIERRWSPDWYASRRASARACSATSSAHPVGQHRRRGARLRGLRRLPRHQRGHPGHGQRRQREDDRPREAGGRAPTRRGPLHARLHISGVLDADFYKIEVAHRGALTFSKRELASNGWHVETKLGVGADTFGLPPIRVAEHPAGRLDTDGAQVVGDGGVAVRVGDGDRTRPHGAPSARRRMPSVLAV